MIWLLFGSVPNKYPIWKIPSYVEDFALLDRRCISWGGRNKGAVCWILGAALWWIGGHHINLDYIVSVSNNGEFTPDFLGLFELSADRTAMAITVTREAHPWCRLSWLDDKVGCIVHMGLLSTVGMYNGIVPKLQQLAAADSLLHVLCTANILEVSTKSADHNIPD